MIKFNLRAHHLLCIQGYQGYGYSELFTENMNYITNILKEENVKIKIRDFEDDICKKCPNLNNKICINTEENSKIEFMDRYILNKLNYTGEEVFFNKIIEKLNTLLTREDIDNICGKCKWINECLFYQKYYKI